ncbi:type II toxin-antitoxin system HicB family antitoxin [Marinobacterium sp. D7]|uniref:type II toxin-antitoxin system HicB family antitoxin n=1 Tax=Marinobacterium ramblicola TaxID=2849041 RepID=UPI001C2DA0E1|nr:type II toxin-antitoxin system HicB family antitoxin [Marinobacterium ramblicola]MBV1788614.1 type II toxin-antitoxin system HicB family antitoxin [Marinobacterium ramblicola]
MKYPVIVEPDGGGWLVTFPDVPEALTGGDTREEVLKEAVGALVTAFEFYFEDRRAVPLPSDIQAGAESVVVPDSVWRRVLQFNDSLALPE